MLTVQQQQTRSRPKSRQGSPSPYGHRQIDSNELNGLEAGLLEKSNDVEAQKDKPRLAPTPGNVGAEYEVSTNTKLVYLGTYFALNLLLTIYNKFLLGGFSYPWLLTTIHSGCTSIGCYFLLMQGYFKLTELSRRENWILVAYSFLFTLNIAISNVSLNAVSVAFHQIARSTCPVFAILIYRLVYKRSYSRATYLSLIPIVIGVAIATYGDYYFTITGFILTFLGVVLAAVKTVVSNRMMTGSLKLPALEILLRMCPLAAFQSLLYSVATGEVHRFLESDLGSELPTGLIILLLGNGILAFILNVSSFLTNKLAGALTLTVAGNLKQCLTILIGITLFKVRVGPANGMGMFITVLGAAWYSKVELDSKGKR